ncbi:hypothetical protein R3P38DRAFT_2529723, partial [Favolaschia claudopus]
RMSAPTRRFMDAYHRELDGKWAAWAGKKYHGHRVLPESLMIELEAAMAKEKADREATARVIAVIQQLAAR